VGAIIIISAFGDSRRTGEDKEKEAGRATFARFLFSPLPLLSQSQKRAFASAKSTGRGKNK